MTSLALLLPLASPRALQAGLQEPGERLRDQSSLIPKGEEHGAGGQHPKLPVSTKTSRSLYL